MTIKAYLLINTQPGTSEEVAEQLAEMPNIVDAHRVTGPYDVILILETEDLYTLGTIVSENIHAVPGIRSTMTCIKVRE